MNKPIIAFALLTVLALPATRVIADPPANPTEASDRKFLDTLERADAAKEKVQPSASPGQPAAPVVPATNERAAQPPQIAVTQHKPEASPIAEAPAAPAVEEQPARPRRTASTERGPDVVADSGAAADPHGKVHKKVPSVEKPVPRSRRVTNEGEAGVAIRGDGSSPNADADTPVVAASRATAPLTQDVIVGNAAPQPAPVVRRTYTVRTRTVPAEEIAPAPVQAVPLPSTVTIVRTTRGEVDHDHDQDRNHHNGFFHRLFHPHESEVPPDAAGW
jgi:hypothetical protein